MPDQVPDVVVGHGSVSRIRPGPAPAATTSTRPTRSPSPLSLHSLSLAIRPGHVAVTGHSEMLTP